MKKLILLLLLISFSSYGQFIRDNAQLAPIRQSIEKVFRTLEGQPLTPSMKVYFVVDAIKFHIEADTAREDIARIRENIAADNGPVASVLFGQGFNYAVLRYLRLLVNHDPTKSSYGIIDVATLMDTEVGKSSAGIPMFERLGSADWKVNMGGVMELVYDGDVYWALDRTRSMVDEAITRAGKGGYSFLDLLYRNRVSEVERLIDFTNRVEAVLNQYQGFLISIQIRANQNKDNEKVHNELLQLKGRLAGEKDQFLKEINGILDSASRLPGDKTPWKSLGRAVSSNRVSLTKLEDTYKEIAHKYLQEMDAITGTSKSDSKYAKYSPIELNASRIQQWDENKAIRDEWNKNAKHEYHKRDDVWDVVYKHSEEHGPYLETSRNQDSEAVNFIQIPPILEEQYAVRMLIDAFERLTNGRPNGDQIRDLRADLEARQREHAAYVATGGPAVERDAPPELRNGYEQRFKTRNAIIAKWLVLAIESTHRQEAHEKAGYLGLQYSSDLRTKYETITEKLKATQKKLVRARVGIGVTVGGAAAAACYLWMAAPGF